MQLEQLIEMKILIEFFFRIYFRIDNNTFYDQTTDGTQFNVNIKLLFVLFMMKYVGFILINYLYKFKWSFVWFVIQLMNIGEKTH